MNYTGYLLGFCYLGETGNSIIVIEQAKKQVFGLKLFPGGNKNVVIKKKEFKQLLSRGILEPIEKIPTDIFAEFALTWKNNSERVELPESMV
jgi:hypothetical protein